MKKITAFLMTLAMLLSLCACSATPAQSEAPDPDVSQGPTWQEQFDLGIRYLSEGNYEEAIIAFTAAIEIDPKRAPAYVGRGDAYAASGEAEASLAAAKADYERAIELDETSMEAYLGLADVYVRREEYEKALEVLHDALEKTENDQKIADKISDLETVYISSMVEAEDYSFLFDDVNDVVMPWEWKINGKTLNQCELSDFQLEYPNELEYGLTMLDDYIWYQPGLENAPNGNIEVQISARQIQIALQCEAFVSDEYYQADFYYPPNFRNITTNDTYDSVLKKIGFSDTGIEFMKTVENDFSSEIYDMNDTYRSAKFRVDYMISDDGFKSIWIHPSWGQESVHPNATAMSIVFMFYGESLYSITCFYDRNT